MPLLTPKMRFRLNRWRNRLLGERESLREETNEIFIQQKMCPACRALVDRNARQCPFCGQTLKVIGTGPTARMFSRVMPTDVPYSGYILTITLLLYAVESLLSGSWTDPTSVVLYRLGVSAPLGYVIATHEYWRWVTAIFLHGGLLHIGFNLWALLDLGPLVESAYGQAKFLTAYMLTGAFGFAVSSATGHVSLGASGALFGMLGVMATYGMRRHDSVAKQMRAQISRWIIYALIWSFLPGIDMMAHVGGLASGFAFGWLVNDEPPITEGQIRFWRVIQTLVIIGTATCFVMMATAGQR